MSGNNTDTWPKWVTEVVRIAAPDPAWPAKAADVCRLLEQQLSDISVKDFEHIGSTSVPGLPAKPVIDIIAEVPDFEPQRMELIARRLRPMGWHFAPPELDQRPYRRFFIKVVADARTVHLQFLLPGSPQRTDQIRFRDVLKATPTLKTAYANL